MNLLKRSSARLRHRTILTPMLLTLVPVSADARLNPLRIITSRTVRPEVLIALNTGASMRQNAAGDAEGSDCSGANSADLCGDGMCSGQEQLGSCLADCPLPNHFTPAAGATAACDAATSQASRLWLAKQALTTVLPALRTTASFGLVTFEQSGVFEYAPADAIPTPNRRVTILLLEQEMRSAQSWTGGGAWLAGPPESPATSFSTNFGGNTTFTLLSDPSVQADPSITQDSDSLYRRWDGSQFVFTRFRWSIAGRRHVDGSGNQWEYVGSYYSYLQDRPDVGASPTTFPDYRGPQFNDGSTTWIYHRYNHGGDQGLTSNSNGTVLVSLTEGSSQSDYDGQLARAFNRLNLASNGGLLAVSGTTGALDQLIKTANDHFQARVGGSSPFSAVDPASTCRPRFVVLITDSSSASTGDLLSEVQDLCSQGIRTLAIGLPGLSDPSELDAVADAGDCDAQVSSTALTATNLQELVDNLQDALVEHVRGDFATSAAGVATTPTGNVSENLALIASTEVPQWRGHLRAYDLSVPTCLEDSSSCLRWDAGQRLESRVWSQRKLYTGRSDVDGGNPITLIDNAGNVNIDGNGFPAGSFGSVGIRDVWPTAPAADAELAAFIQDLAGKNSSWKLPAFFRVTPATVTAPPVLLGAPGHGGFESSNAQRQTLIYAPSNDGVLHAFDLEGNEKFGYVPPHLLDALYALYQAGGQSSDPTQYTLIQVNSPRVQDLSKDGTTEPWRTYLVQTDGAGSEDFYVLDITSPATCTDITDPTTCGDATPLFRVAFESAGTLLDSTMGQTWSIPALFWTTSAKAQMAFASGYDATGEGRWYNFLYRDTFLPWEDLTSLQTADLDDAGTSKFPAANYAVVSNSAAVLADPGQVVTATFQGDLAGRISRFGIGLPTNDSVVLNAGASHPFQLAPATLFRGGQRATIAANSGAFEDEELLIDDGGSPGITFDSDGTTFVSRLFMRTENNGGVDVGSDNFDCDVTSVCSSGCYNGGQILPAACIAPSARAMPTDSPLMIVNDVFGNRTEAFFTYYEPPSNVCSGSEVAFGNSYVVRVASNGNSQTLVALERYQGVYVSGLTIAGGGTDLLITKSGLNAAEAAATTFSGKPIGMNVGTIVEGWREVR